MSETMRAISIVAERKVELVEMEKPVPLPHECLVKVMAGSICTVEQRMFVNETGKTKYPVIPCHEASGIVVETGSAVKFLKKGDHVILGRDNCGVCESCRMGRNVCEPSFENGNVEASAAYMCEYVVKDEANLTKVNDDVPFYLAALGEPISCICRSVNRSRLVPGETVAVIGGSLMGLIHLEIAKLHGASTVIVSEPDADRRRVALECGADYVVDPTAEDPVAFVKAHTGGKGVDVVYSTIVISSVFEQSMKMLANGGRIMAYASQHPDIPISVSLSNVHYREIEIVGILGSGPKEFTEAATLLNSGKLNLDICTECVYPIQKCQEAFEASITPVYRSIIDMST